jgi:hypothetical protein
MRHAPRLTRTEHSDLGRPHLDQSPTDIRAYRVRFRKSQAWRSISSRL